MHGVNINYYILHRLLLIMVKLQILENKIYKLSFKKSDIYNRRVIIHKLKEKHFEGQLILKFTLRSVHFCSDMVIVVNVVF